MSLAEIGHIQFEEGREYQMITLPKLVQFLVYQLEAPMVFL